MRLVRGDPFARAFMTPEGVPVTVKLASLVSRAVAFAVDLLVMGTLVLAVLALAFVTSGTDDSSWLQSVALLTSFLVRNFYFAFLELRMEGATIGKRLFGLRVVNRKGGTLSAGAVLARNLMREVELFAPIAIVASMNTSDVDVLWLLMVCTWGLMLTLLPLLDTDHLRLGDRVGGTVVVELEKAVLLPDLSLASAGRHPLPGHASHYQFSDADLDRYGIYELHVLEKVLREASERDGQNACVAVCSQIRETLSWVANKEFAEKDTMPFLYAYYAALRDRLERKMLLGERREDKHAIARG